MAVPAPDYCCPLCERPCPQIEGLKVVNHRVYWKGNLVTWGKGEYRGGAATDLFIFLYKNAGKEQRISTIYKELYGHHHEGGPSGENFRVITSRVRRALLREAIPVRIDTTRSVRGGDPTSGSLVLYLLDEK